MQDTNRTTCSPAAILPRVSHAARMWRPSNIKEWSSDSYARIVRPGASFCTIRLWCSEVFMDVARERKRGRHLGRSRELSTQVKTLSLFRYSHSCYTCMCRNQCKCASSHHRYINRPNLDIISHCACQALHDKRAIPQPISQLSPHTRTQAC